jgi:hypothetical protein
MNMKVGDIVRMKDSPTVCGEVISIEYFKGWHHNKKYHHIVRFHSGHGYDKFKHPFQLQVIRRKK